MTKVFKISKIEEGGDKKQDIYMLLGKILMPWGGGGRDDGLPQIQQVQSKF